VPTHDSGGLRTGGHACRRRLLKNNETRLNRHVLTRKGLDDQSSWPPSTAPHSFFVKPPECCKKVDLE